MNGGTLKELQAPAGTKLCGTPCKKPSAKPFQYCMVPFEWCNQNLPALIIWVYDYMTIWSYDHMIVWSYDHMIIWSYGHLIISSSAELVLSCLGSIGSDLAAASKCTTPEFSHALRKRIDSLMHCILTWSYGHIIIWSSVAILAQAILDRRGLAFAFLKLVQILLSA